MKNDVYGLNEKLIEVFEWYKDINEENSELDISYENAFEGDYGDFYELDLDYELSERNIYSDNWLDDIDYSKIELNSNRREEVTHNFRFSPQKVAKIFRFYNWRDPYSNEEMVNYVENGQYEIDLRNYVELDCKPGKDNIHTSTMLRSVFDERVYDIWGDTITRSGQYIAAKENMVFKCNECGGQFIKEGVEVYRGSGCPKCHKKWSKGEKVVETILKKLDIEYTKQDSDGCKSPTTGRPLPYDFVIPNRGCVLYVEVNGKQHYEPVNYFGGEESFKKIEYRDNIKKSYANKNGIYVELDYREHDVKLLQQRIENGLLPLLDRGDK
ncbi:MAG: hypothetical protein ACRDDY_16480 [Clostridium sp.]|uniref:hypothetical protein n=1 Tax=Clostridium sp. TaxID=1506 RepID=UPI003EE67341